MNGVRHMPDAMRAAANNGEHEEWEKEEKRENKIESKRESKRERR
jgi:hypothetical protein